MPLAKRVNHAQEVEAVLRKRIHVLRATDGRLPAETDLASEFGVSRVTVREALSSLERRGLILRRQGLGTFVNRNVSDLQLRLDESVEFSELIRTAGFEAGLASVTCEIGTAPEAIARQLLIEANDPVLNIRKVFTANGSRVIFCLNVIPLNLVPADQHADLLKLLDPTLSVYNLLARSFHERVAYQLSEVGAQHADLDVAGMLGADACTPLLVIEEIGYNDGQRPVFYGLEHYVPGLIHFRFIRKPVYSMDDSA